MRNTNLPSSLVACKCDNDEDDWEVDVDGMSGHKVFHQCIGSYKVTTDRPDLSKACLNATLKAAIIHRKGSDCTSSNQLSAAILTHYRGTK